MLHKIHIPVMGICYTADTPLRVAHYGITSVISLVDDGLLEDYRLAYAKRLGIDVGEKESSREKRIKMYLDFLTDETERKFNWICGLHFDGKSAKDIYFKMLPANSPLKKEYEAVCSKTGLARLGDEVALTKKMQCGEIQANIMVNLNYKDAAIDAVRGFANSKVRGSLVLSAGVNLAVFEEIAKHGCFYKKDSGWLKKIIIKVSDFRSALIQGKYLAKKGIEVYEYRIESGINCGGHAFFENAKLLPDVLKEFIEKKQELFDATYRLIKKARELNSEILLPEFFARITVQGGICSAEEVSQVLKMGADCVGVGTPFLLVPAVTSCDAKTRARLAAATQMDVFLSKASPLGVPFMNLKTSTAAELCQKKVKAYFEQRKIKNVSCNQEKPANNDDLKPGFLCKQHYLCKNIEGFNHAVCKASREYVVHRLQELDELEKQELEALANEKSALDFIRKKYDNLRKETLECECICRFLGNAGREEIREKEPTIHYEREEIAIVRGLQKARVLEPITVCPGPNIAYFNREYSLIEMMQHLYGTGPCLTPANKPHAFALEKSILLKHNFLIRE